MASIRALLFVLSLTALAASQDVLPGLNGGIGRGYDLITGNTKGNDKIKESFGSLSSYRLS